MSYAYIGNDEFEEGALLPVEIGGESIGDAVVSEITDDYVEVLWMGAVHRLSPSISEYFETRRDLSGLEF